MNLHATDAETMPRHVEIKTARSHEGKYETERLFLIAEEPLSIRIMGKPYVVVMRTPGDEIFHAAGLCLTEGIADSPEDIVSIGFCKEDNTNVATVTLSPARRPEVDGILERKGFVSQTSCGICGKTVIEDIARSVRRLQESVSISVNDLILAANSLTMHQPLHKKTRSAHCAVIFNAKLDVLSFAEDVGRHNALDKAIGKVFMAKTIDSAAICVMSSRLSYELVQKAARAGIEVLIGVSRPTALAVSLGRAVGMTLACIRNEDVLVFCGNDRIRFTERQA